jgi:hypothetical protein
MTEPIRTTVVRYKCPFCNRFYSRRQAAKDHMARCWLDPANKTCRTCKHHHWGDPFLDTPEKCDVSEPETFPVVDCPLWALREA